MCEPVNSSANMWDLKVEDFPRFNPKIEPFQAKVFDILDSWGVDFTDKEVLDIGCGTGVYTLHLARKAQKVIGLDFSKGMIDILNQDAKTNNIISINSICMDFKNYNGNPVDLVFCSMSPALLGDEAFEKAFEKAKIGLSYLGWGGKRESSVMKALFEAHGHVLNAPPGADKLKAWMDSKGLKYNKCYLETVWNKKSTLEDAIRFEGWHLKMHGITPNETKVKQVLEEFVDENNKVKVTTKVGLELVAWLR